MTGRKVLILDGNQRSALAATRSLGKRGIPVVVADETEKTLAGSSRFCRETFRYPSPYSRPEEFLAVLRKECRERGVGVLFPMTEVTVHLVLAHREELDGMAIPFSSFETFQKLVDKGELFALAREIGVSMPRTWWVERLTDLERVLPGLRYPVVLKPCRSRTWLSGRWVATSVSYAASELELREATTEIEFLRGRPFLIQEHIPGGGAGVFCLYDQGRPLAFFAHRRLRERPPSGGVSVLSESVEVDPSMREISRKILDRVAWHGVAMVEFRVSPDGTPFLMEVNPRFWGSLQLAIDAGVDFPYLLYRMAVGEEVEESCGYRVGVRSRWLLGDLDHLYLTFKGGAGSPSGSNSRWKALLRFLNFFQKRSRFEVNRCEDLRPFIFELRSYFRCLV